MKNQWIQTTLSSCVKLQSGGTPSKKNPDYWGGDIPWVSSKDFKSIRIYDTEDHITDLAVEHGAKLVSPGTILLAVRGMRLAKELPVAELQCTASFNQDLKALHCTELISPRFLLYWLIASSHKVLGKCDEAAHGTKRLQTELLLSVPIELPTLLTQQRIAEILSTYDNAIANNNQRIALLEESIHKLYKEWFVRLRFPDYESVKVVDGVPEGWKYKTLENVCEIIMGQSPPSKFYNSSDQGLPFHQGVSNFGNRFINHETFCTKINRIAEPGDILCSVRAPVGRLNITTDKIIIGRGLSAIRNRFAHQSFQYYQLKTHFFQEDIIGSGAIFASVTKKQLCQQLMLIPSEDIIIKFEDISKPIDIQITNFHIQNQKLQEARDLLLPRLMNGKRTV